KKPRWLFFFLMFAVRPCALFPANPLRYFCCFSSCLDEQSVMAMFRRSRNPAPPLHRKQQEIAQQEARLREKVESLERIVTQSQAPAPSKSSVREPDRKPSNTVVETRF